MTRIEFLTCLRATGMPIRQMQKFAQLFRQQPHAIADRRAILEAHQQQVQANIDELTRNMEVIQWKIHHYQELEAQQAAGATDSEIEQRQKCLAAGMAFVLERTLQKPSGALQKSAN